MSTPEDVPTAVLDTNAVLDWLVFSDPPAKPLAEALQAHRLIWVATPPMLDELAHVLRRGTLRRWCDEPEQVLTLAMGWVRLVEAPALQCPLHCTDGDDQKFIDLAWSLRTRWLISKDKALLRLTRGARVRGTVICPPARWAVAAPAS